MYRNQVATSSEFGWRIEAELGADINQNSHGILELRIMGWKANKEGICVRELSAFIKKQTLFPVAFVFY